MKIIKCPHCENDNVIGYGYQKKGEHRYKCKDCNRFFQTPLPYDAKRFFSILYNLISRSSNEDKITFNKSQIDDFVLNFDGIMNFEEIKIDKIPQPELNIHSYNPKIAIIFNNDSQIEIYTFNEKVGNEKCYKILVWDQDKNRKSFSTN